VQSLADFLAAVQAVGHRMVNRNPGSGTRVLIDRLLSGLRPDGYTNQPRTHHAVAAAVAQGRADWGVTLDMIAAAAGLRFLFVQEERFDLTVPDARRSRPAVDALAGLLADRGVRVRLGEMGFSA
jgi:putative molybdopterin biosynthesis protein